MDANAAIDARRSAERIIRLVSLLGPTVGLVVIAGVLAWNTMEVRRAADRTPELDTSAVATAIDDLARKLEMIDAASVDPASYATGRDIAEQMLSGGSHSSTSRAPSTGSQIYQPQAEADRINREAPYYR